MSVDLCSTSRHASEWAIRVVFRDLSRSGHIGRQRQHHSINDTRHTYVGILIVVIIASGNCSTTSNIVLIGSILCSTRTLICSSRASYVGRATHYRFGYVAALIR
jgi:hypothetical protein